MGTEEAMWSETFDTFVGLPAFRKMDPGARSFVRDLQKGFSAAAARSESRSQGNRLANTQVLQNAVSAALDRRGIVVDKSAATVEVAMLRKQADISFTHRGKPWIIEIKFGLEFNSLGAAALEALAFRRQKPNARFVLLAMYSKFKHTEAGPDDVAHAVVKDCELGKVFHDVHILSRRKDAGPSWYASCGRLVDRFVGSLPGAAKG